MVDNPQNQRCGDANELSIWKKEPVINEHSIAPMTAALNSSGSPCLPKAVVLAVAL